MPFVESNQIFIIRGYPNNITDQSPDAATSTLTCLINAYGRLLFVEEKKTVCLSRLLNESCLKNGHSIELTCGDASALDGGERGCVAILATLCVELNEHFVPCRHFGAVFRISPTLHVELINKVDAVAGVAHCSIINRLEDSVLQLYWVFYESCELLQVYRLKEDSGLDERVDSVSSVFPELTLDSFPGAVTRSSLTCSDNLRWSALGFDTGHVFLSVFAMDINKTYRKLIKFSGPISVVDFIPCCSSRLISCNKEEDGSHGYREEHYLVVSSTLGPAAVWKCNFDGDSLSWNQDFLLKQSEQFDTITCCCVLRDLIAVGTYSGKILFYSSKCDLLIHEIVSITQIHAPVVVMKVLDETTLCALSTAGLHTVTRSDL
ncbi:hypothetical protein RB195_013242 [Necator americanus]